MASVATAVAKTRLQTLAQLTAKVFGNAYNPSNQRTGNKILNARLIGPTVLSYYPDNKGREMRLLKKITREFPELELVNVAEQERWEEVDRRRRRGKGPPQKGMLHRVCAAICAISRASHAYKCWHSRQGQTCSARKEEMIRLATVYSAASY